MALQKVRDMASRKMAEEGHVVPPSDDFGVDQFSSSMKDSSTESGKKKKKSLTVPIPVLDEASPLEQMKQDMDRAADIYKGRLQKSDLFDKKQPPDKAQSEIRKQHDKYAMMMVVAMMAPLAKERSAKSVVESVSMGVAMWALSPQFRHTVTHFGSTALRNHREAVADRVRSKVDSAKASDQKVGRRWQRRLERIERKDRNGHAPFTEYSAAMTHLALNEKAYREMRKPGADVQEVQKAHQHSVHALYSMASQDGLDPNDVAAMSRRLVGDVVRDKPEHGAMYSELAWNQVVMSKPRPVRDRDGNVSEKWDGSFVMNGAKYNQGVFSVRPPLTADEHTELVSAAMTNTFMSSKSPADLHRAMFVVAAAQHEPFQNKDLSASDRAVVDTVKKMTASMEADGMTHEQAQEALATGFFMAVDTVADKRPKLAKGWADKYGPAGWAKEFREMVENPEAASQRWKPASESARGKAARQKGDQRRRTALNKERQETTGVPRTARTKSGDKPPIDRQRDGETVGIPVEIPVKDSSGPEM